MLDRKNDTVCQTNIDSVSQILKEKDIPVRACALGGTQRRMVRLDVETGTVMYSEGDGKGKLLWQPQDTASVKQPLKDG